MQQLWTPSYPTPVVAGWKAVQAAAPDRLYVENGLLRAELRPGDVVPGNGHRAEAMARYPSPWSTPASKWPDPPGALRRYVFDVYFPSDFKFGTDTRWLVFTQFKQVGNGGPMLTLEVLRNKFRVAGAHIPAATLSAVPLGGKATFDLTARWAADQTGMVRLLINGVAAMSYDGPNLDLIDGVPGAVYVKQGIYRSTVWTVIHVLRFSPIVIYEPEPDFYEQTAA